VGKSARGNILSKASANLSAKIRDFMEVPPKVIPADATIDDAAGTMWDLNIGSVMVVDKEGHMVGIITVSYTHLTLPTICSV